MRCNTWPSWVRDACAASPPNSAVLAAAVPQEVLKRYEKGKDIAMLSGPAGLRAIKGFHDEALSGECKGQRSSRLGLQWRVIYQRATGVMLIQVVEVPAHDYRRR